MFFFVDENSMHVCESKDILKNACEFFIFIYTFVWEEEENYK